jgi:hypothetical protein
MSNKRKTPRNSDGTLRRANRSKHLTMRSLIARWVEAETLHLKRLGMSDQAIAQHLVAVARGQQAALVQLPADLRFPDDYRISLQAVHKAFKRAIVRLPNAEAVELRKLDSARLDDMLLSLQTGIRQGDPRSVEVAVKLLVHKAELNGYKAPTGIDARLNVLVQEHAAGDAQTRADLAQLTLAELREYRRLEAKAQGRPDASTSAAVALSSSDMADTSSEPHDTEGEPS